jgi:hypothetical protein
MIRDGAQKNKNAPQATVTATATPIADPSSY